MLGWCARARARRRARGKNQFGRPIRQSPKRCACIWPMWLRPSPSVISLPTISRHFCSSDGLSCRGWVFCAACGGAANAIRESNSTIILISVSELFRHHARSTRTRTRSFCEIFVTLARTPCLTCCVLPCIDRAHGARDASRENAAHATPADGPRRYGGRAERQERTTCAREWLACVAVGDSEILLSQKRARPSR